MSVRSAFIKLMVFASASSFVLLIMWNTLSNATTGPTYSITALFTTASGLHSGDSVRIAGVRVGRVDAIALVNDVALVTLSIEQAHPVLTNTRLVIRYENLLGRRFVALEPGLGQGTPLPDGATVPTTRTEPAFDLTVLMNGFQPLFNVLSSGDINRLSGTIINVLQGEGSSVADLIQQAGQVTNEFAKDDGAIGQVIDNLSGVLVQLERKDGQFTDLVTQLTRLTNGLANNRNVITNTIDSVGSMSAAVDGLVAQTRPQVRVVAAEANTVMGIYAREHTLIGALLGELPAFFAAPTRAFQHGSWFTLYPCELFTSPFAPNLLGVVGHQHTAVCR